MMNNSLVDVANHGGPSLRAAFPLMLNDLTGVPGLSLFFEVPRGPF